MRVSTKTLEKLAGCVWLAVGGMLAWRGIKMIFGLSDDIERAGVSAIVMSLGIGAWIGYLKGRYVLSRTARRNLRRVRGLAEPRIWNVFSARFLVVIALMIGLGAGLRWMARQGWLGGHAGVGGIYFGIGTALLISSLVYFLRPPPALPTRSESEPADLNSTRGLIVVNLGTPEAPTPRAVRRYLREFLGDPRVIEVNRILWAFVLNVIILPFRSGKSAEAYQKVWTDEGSPLLRFSARTKALLAERLGSDWQVELAMRYGRPSLGEAIEKLTSQGCREITVLPLFPQFSNTTIGTIQARVSEIVSNMRDQPALRFIPSYPDQPDYIDALAARIIEKRGEDSVDNYVFSFHGLPEAYVKAGDPYVEECARTAWALARRLELQREQWEMVFQSRFGDEPWLQPYLDEYVPALAGKKVLVAQPGFAADCLETLEEVVIRLDEVFRAAGGEGLICVPALNDHPRWIDALENIVLESAGKSALASSVG